VAIGQLVDQGKLAFTDTVGKILLDYPNKAVAERVTLHHLLTHTSGMGDYFSQEYFQGSKDRWRRVADYAPLYVNNALEFQPGDEWRYSNAGFMLLGAIVEKVSGQDYFTYVRENVYKPAGMANTDAYEMDRDTPNLAIGYTTNSPQGPMPPGQRQNNLYLHVVKGGPAGGGFSTVEDLQKFAAALLENKLLSAKMTETVISGKVQSGFLDPNERYGYGFDDNRTEGAHVVGHSGGFAGINSDLNIYLADGRGAGYVVAVMSNYDPPAASRVAGKLRALILQQ
jgi:CubicO group peptidase (beta-lactamase class C family)